MSAVAKANDWRGFDIGERAGTSGWLYRCDGMPTLMGCGESVVVTRRWTRVGQKKTGWLVCYGRDEGPGDDGKGNDLDVVLTFCPSCAGVVAGQDGDR